jgi:hypothetical protein
MKKIVEMLDENYLYVTEKHWTFELDDEKQRQFGVVFQIIDVGEATGEPEFKQYPFIVEATILADKPHKSFDESGDKCPSSESLKYDCLSYMGGIPITHRLDKAVKCSTEHGEAWDALCKQFSVNEAVVVSSSPQFGTVAAQQGKNTAHQYLQFKDYKSARKYVDYIVQNRLDAIGMMIGFILDRPINMMGEDGWSIIRKQVFGCRNEK